MKKFNFPLERMLNYQEQDLEKERGIMSRLLAARTGLEEKKAETYGGNGRNTVRTGEGNP